MHERAWERRAWLGGTRSVLLPLQVGTGDSFLGSSDQNKGQGPIFFSPCPVRAPLSVEKGFLSVGGAGSKSFPGWAGPHSSGHTPGDNPYPEPKCVTPIIALKFQTEGGILLISWLFMIN